MANKEFGNALWITETASISKVEEMFLLAGPRIRIAPNSYLTIQYGMLNDKMSLNTIVPVLDAAGLPVVDPTTQLPQTKNAADELSINKNVIVADVTVNF
jgi:hypothetical protein